jgi:hypothetical protein
MKKLLAIFLFVFILYLNFFEPKNFPDKESVYSFDKNEILESDVDIQIKKGFLFKNYKGKIVYSKNCLDLKIGAQKEFLEIGCNKYYFWYFSSDEAVLYYGESKDSYFLIKEIFNPQNLLNILFAEKESVVIGNYGKVLEKVVEFKNEKLKIISLYDNQNLVYKVSYIEYAGVIPRKMEVYYAEENVLVKITINKLNSINDYDFSMPIKKYEQVEKLSP